MESVLAIYYLCIDIYIVSTLLYETSTLADRNNAIWDINALFDAFFKGSLSSTPITYRLMYATGVYQKEQR
jgi:hypothetical protein